MSHNNNEMSLVRLGSAQPEPLDNLTRLRGRIVIGIKGNEIGTITDFYIDSVELVPQCLQVMLRGTQQEKLIVLIPLTTIENVTAYTVQLNESRDQILTMPKITGGEAQQRFLQWNFYQTR